MTTSVAEMSAAERLWQYYTNVRAYNDTTSADKKAAFAALMKTLTVPQSETKYLERYEAIADGVSVVNKLIMGKEAIATYYPYMLRAYIGGIDAKPETEILLGLAEKAGLVGRYQRPLAVAWWWTSPQVQDVKEIKQMYDTFVKAANRPNLVTGEFNPTEKQIWELQTNNSVDPETTLFSTVVKLQSRNDRNYSWQQFFTVALGIKAQFISTLIDFDFMKKALSEAEMLAIFGAEPNLFQFVQSHYCTAVFASAFPEFLGSLTREILKRKPR